MLTDGGVWWGPNGEEWKRFCFADIMGVSLARKAGLIVALISGEDSPLVDRFAAKMGITDVEKGCKDKARALRAFAERRGLQPRATLTFMGDDVNDLEAMALAGLAAAPAGAVPATLARATFVSTRPGGHGAVRELVDAILRAKRMMKLSDYVIQFIADQGVKHVFLVTGGGAMHLNESLVRFPQIVPVCNLHEQASAIAAENYSKATNHLGVAIVTTGPGGTNAITGVAGAWLDSTPMLVVSGQVKRSDRMFATRKARRPGSGSSGVQEIDIVPIVESITKYAVTIEDPASIRYHLEKAIYLAAQRPPRAGMDRHPARRAGQPDRSR